MRINHTRGKGQLMMTFQLFLKKKNKNHSSSSHPILSHKNVVHQRTPLINRNQKIKYFSFCKP